MSMSTWAIILDNALVPGIGLAADLVLRIRISVPVPVAILQLKFTIHTGIFAHNIERKYRIVDLV